MSRDLFKPCRPDHAAILPGVSSKLSKEANATGCCCDSNASAILIRHADGTPRCRHFNRAASVAPSSAAVSSTSFHVRGLSGMDRLIGQSVQIVKDIVSNDFAPEDGQMCPMAIWGPEQAYNEAFIARVKDLREEKGWTAEQMAIALGIPAERYRKYEYRSLLPQYLVERFAQIVDRDVAYVMTGKSAIPTRGSRRAARTGTSG